ncbi:MAG: hypothetical protein VW405_19460, partial [Rhodospirillaceae bacterium]
MQYPENNGWRPQDGKFLPTGPAKELDPDDTIANHLRRGDGNFGAYGEDARPLLEEAFRHWNELWQALYGNGGEGVPEVVEVAASHIVSRAWRLYTGRCVRWMDVDVDGTLGEDHPLAYRFPLTRDDHRGWGTEEGYHLHL